MPGRIARIWTAVAMLIAASSVSFEAAQADSPSPLTAAQQPADWWFAFKFNGAKFPGCAAQAARACPFGGTPNASYARWSQQYAVASRAGGATKALQAGPNCLGDSAQDPVGATFGQIYNGTLHYVIWNDQFYDDPKIAACTKECGSPWGHSKGVLAWDDDGNGVVMQGTTPAWPISGGPGRESGSNGNSLGCTSDNNVQFSQHYFSLKLTVDDVAAVLQAMIDASVTTDPQQIQIVNPGGPQQLQSLVSSLGNKSPAPTTVAYPIKLSSGVLLIAKQSRMHVPPWQMVSSLLGGVDLRTATWSQVSPVMGSTTRTTPIACWDDLLTSKPGAVEVATTGNFNSVIFGLTGANSPNSADHNHAKFGVTTAPGSTLTILGDMNQQGTLSGANCASSQNGRGGMFFVVNDAALHDSVAALLQGDTAPLDPSDPASGK